MFESLRSAAVSISRSRIRILVVAVALVLLLVMQLVAVVFAGVSAERSAVSVAEDAIRREGSRTVESILRHLEPAEQSVEVTTRLLADRLLDDAEPGLERYLYTQLAVMPQMTGAFVGYPDGAFVFVSRDGDGYRSKRITGDTDRSVHVRHYDATFAEVRDERPTDDTYDPRARPWYVGASGSTGLEWTDPYVFFSSGKPGVTASRAVRDSAGDVTAIVGVDVELSGLAAFIDQLSVSEHGEAFVVSGDIVVAAPSRYETQTEVAEDGSLRLLTTDELDVEALALSSRGTPTLRTVAGAHGGTDLVLHAAFPNAQGLEWAVVVRAPRSDFTGAVRQQQRSLLWTWVAGAALIAIGALVMLRVTRPLQALHTLAGTDPLTGVANRRMLADASAQLSARVRRDGDLLAVLMVDLDRFKNLNDSHGHAVGDRALQLVGEELQSLAGDSRVAGRLGGDEFVVAWAAETHDVAELDGSRIVRAIGEVLRAFVPDLDGLGASGGLAVGDPNVVDFDELAHRADRALIEQKASARGRLGVAGVPATT